MSDELIEKKCLDFVQSIRALRIARKMTQEDLAAETGLTQPNVARIERGAYKPNLDTIMRVAIALDAELNLSEK